ncbi:hypothetical protein ACHAXT_002206 [Thalassiosira profunda]
MDSSNKTSRAPSIGVVETPAPTEEAVPSPPTHAERDRTKPTTTAENELRCRRFAPHRRGARAVEPVRRLEEQRPPPPEGADGGGWGVGAAGSMGMRRRGRFMV